MKLLVFGFAILSVALAARDENKWKSFKGKLGKLTFDSKREQEYKERFFEVVKIIEENNANKNATFKMALNEYSHIPVNDFIKQRTGYKASPPPKNPLKWKGGLKGPVPASIDYHKMGLVTPVKNQGTCGSCYSFAVAAAVEGQAIKFLGIRDSLSNQQIVDCAQSYGTLGCDGGDPTAAFNYVRDAGGLAKFADYPYTGKVGVCARMNPLVTILGSKRYTMNTPETVKSILTAVGPLVVAMNAIPDSLNQYKNGIYREPKCKNTQMRQLNHAVTLVGYGVENGIPYWKIKNSWGPQWGEGGYFRIDQGRDCGVTLDVYQPGL